MRNKSGIFVVIGLVVLLLFYAISVQRSLVDLSENINAALGDIEVQYQRRADLIPNIVETVKAQAIKEQEIFTQIAEARAKLAGAATVQEQAAADAEVSSVLGRLLAITENYPELKQNEAFKELRVELEGTENRIAVARKYYNDNVKVYNKKIKVFPTNIVAGMMGYTDEYEYIKAAAGAEQAPKVNLTN